MKITDVKLRFAKHYLFVQVYTDAGIVGLGEAGNWGYLQATAAAIEKFATYLIGKDPFRIEDYNQNFLRSVYFRGSVIMSAISAIDIALWDIKGKALGVPVYELLGGKTREKVRVYASVMHLTEDKQELAKQYQQLQEMGFTAAKIFCNGPTSSPDGKGEFFSSRIEREVEKVRVAREAVGPDFDFVLEVHRGMTLPEAVAFGRAVEPYRPMILEDPVPPDNVDTMAEVASKVGVPIATGERAIDLREFEVLMARHACQYVRPDVCAVGGITTSKKICALAEAHDVLVIPHNPLGPISTIAALHIDRVVPNFEVQEWPGTFGDFNAMIKGDSIKVENGYITMDRDGLITLTPSGMDIASRMLDRHHTLTKFLMELGVDAKTAEEDACKMEHDISEQTYAALCRHAIGKLGILGEDNAGLGETAGTDET